ncbi:recombinational repair (RAD54) protein [Theileria annulata]|uniref:Recombinational repair (RAD54 homologue) protein n=1 Tax=Theileria annulata TaxID=5874 RepID=Q4UHZ3_THEAN|nr:recombinational repair (RAD54) protein [Theileria annulata]CAI73296.1 recombinational repair (RAD54 homologue) protein [Theileria annulata]|eukprot:XP_953973.1 recombinational repair (RAD54 homologue) protein [Theileria annulata]
MRTLFPHEKRLRLTNGSEEDSNNGNGYYGSNICLIRAPLFNFLSVEAGTPIILKPFKSPLEGHQPGVSEESQRKTLGCRIKSDTKSFLKDFRTGIYLEKPESLEDLPPDNPLVLYTSDPEDEVQVEIKVDSILSRFLRDHQRQGVQFIFDCLMGLKGFNGRGCILADDMGLGKTLQSITVMWTLLNQGLDNKPGKTHNYTSSTAARKCAIICPASLVNNWESEIKKWLRGKCPCTAVAESSKEKVISSFQGFKYDRTSKVIISSYETYRLHCSYLEGVNIDLLICDEAHRLKNDKTRTSQSISTSSAQMRLMLSGTPIQNDLNEFYSLVSLCNPDVLGDVNNFRRNFANPILIGREPYATPAEQQKASERLAELSNITNQFVLRRTNALLAKVLPPKIILNVFCNLTDVQKDIYKSFVNSKRWKNIMNQDRVESRALSAIQSLMKLCNHPYLIKRGGLMSSPDVDSLLLDIENATKSSKYKCCRCDLSGKFLVLFRLLYQIRKNSNDRVVIISNYTQTLDLFERLCKECSYPFERLDGGTSIKKRHKLVTTFNDPNSNSFVFLLSSKAGGCGINLIGANRLVLFDPDWNPANDKQALARVWRDGQTKVCYIYRFFSTGTIEEKIYQRQICKDGLSSMLVTDGINELKDSLSGEYLKNLFEYKEEVLSDTHDLIECKRCSHEDGMFLKQKDMLGTVMHVPQLKEFLEDDLNTWAHHADLTTIPDQYLVNAATKNEPQIQYEDMRLSDDFVPVSFVMACRIEFQDTEESVDVENMSVKKIAKSDTVSTTFDSDNEDYVPTQETIESDE